jgi:hypothetical protein
VFNTSVYVDFSRATLNDLVEDLVRTDLGYGEKDISVSNDVGLLYDPDETENLEKKLSELGLAPDSFLTIVDDDEEQPFVNVVVNLLERYILSPPLASLWLDLTLSQPKAVRRQVDSGPGRPAASDPIQTSESSSSRYQR